MKTTLKTDTFTITLSEIDFDNETQTYEITFTASIANGNDYEFNLAHRHSDAIYVSIIGDSYSDDIHDYSEQFIDNFGTQIYEFVTSHAKLFNLPIHSSES